MLSALELETWQRARSRARRIQGALSLAVLKAFDTIRANVSDTDLEEIIRTHALDRLVADVAAGGSVTVLIDRAFLGVSVRIRQAVESAFTTAVRDLPDAGRVDGVVGVAFDYLSPHVVDGIRQLDTKVVETLAADTRDVVKAFVENGLRDGDSASTIARELRQVIGLSPTQLENTIKYEAKLEADASLSDAAVERMVTAYTRRAVALNAETVSRTASLDAMKLGQDLAWRDAMDRGIVEPGSLNKTWKGVMDDRERDEHVAMEGETVPFEAPYSNGQMIPGEDEYNCRCISMVTVQ
jgi:hypothetical protein